LDFILFWEGEKKIVIINVSLTFFAFLAKDVFELERQSLLFDDDVCLSLVAEKGCTHNNNTIGNTLSS